MCNGSIWAFDEVRLDARVVVTGDLRTTDDVRLGNDAVVHGTIFEELESISVPPIPIVASFNSGNGTIQARKGDTVSLSPGSHGRIIINKGGTLYLEAPGTYFFANFELKNGGFFSYPSGTEMYVTRIRDWRGQATMRDAGAYLVIYQRTENTSTFNADFSGTMIAPNARINLNSRGTYGHGFFVGKRVFVDNDTAVMCGS